ncbi:hypothetical protein B296_00025271 [Ensete ventricosum]|uniref:Uncharacterized protein n=1 Tax=Ensete ventricosum TaxID=4639 RepID=A0A427A246_ENSVE|nr:hypothetical protein B296_00025271 [Ensete ventricosum]
MWVHETSLRTYELFLCGRVLYNLIAGLGFLFSNLGRPLFVVLDHGRPLTGHVRFRLNQKGPTKIDGRCTILSEKMYG